MGHPHDKDIASVPHSVAYMFERLSGAEMPYSEGALDLRSRIARRLGVSTGTVENFQRGRLKFLERIELKIEAAFIRLLEAEIRKATDELKIARATRVGVDGAAISEAETALRARMEEARRALS